MGPARAGARWLVEAAGRRERPERAVASRTPQRCCTGARPEDEGANASDVGVGLCLAEGGAVSCTLTELKTERSRAGRQREGARGWYKAASKPLSSPTRAQGKEVALGRPVSNRIWRTSPIGILARGVPPLP